MSVKDQDDEPQLKYQMEEHSMRVVAQFKSKIYFDGKSLSVGKVESASNKTVISPTFISYLCQKWQGRQDRRAGR